MPATVSQDLKRSKRWSILPAYTIDGYITWEIYQSSITAALFNDFVKNQVLPLCSRDGHGPRSVLVLDNARTHWNEELKEMCAEANVLLARLPPYSPDFNPIEISFAILKAWIKRNSQLISAYIEENGGFGQFLYDAVCDHQATGDPENLFRLAGIDYQL